MNLQFAIEPITNATQRREDVVQGYLRLHARQQQQQQQLKSKAAGLSGEVQGGGVPLNASQETGTGGKSR